jgi:threonyl-tRNA synthetase
LSGLTRVRRFQQDDAHIFCRQDQVRESKVAAQSRLIAAPWSSRDLLAPYCAGQVMAEVQGFLQLLDDVYTVFGLEYSMALSTRPESYLVRVWIM